MSLMFKYICQNRIQIIALALISIVFVGCDQAQPTVYDIPKEERSAKLTLKSEQKVSPTSNSANMQILPGMQESANSAPEINYTVPETWQSLEPSGIRKANLRIDSDDGSAEVTVLTFPGDVGGTLANINRWRDQIGLEPATSETINKFSQPCEIVGHQGLYVRLDGESQSILGAILPFHENTWFFKMMGDTPVVIANEALMKQFLSSVRFADHGH